MRGFLICYCWFWCNWLLNMCHPNFFYEWLLLYLLIGLFLLLLKHHIHEALYSQCYLNKSLYVACIHGFVHAICSCFNLLLKFTLRLCKCRFVSTNHIFYCFPSFPVIGYLTKLHYSLARILPSQSTFMKYFLQPLLWMPLWM